MDSNKLYTKFSGMIHSFAWKFSRQYSIPLEDFLGEAHVIFCEAIETYDPNRSSFSTHLYTRLQAISHFAAKEHLYSTRFSSYNSPVSSDESDLKTLEDFLGVADPTIRDHDLNDYTVHIPKDAQTLAAWFNNGELCPPDSSKDKKGKPLNPWSIHMRKATKHGWSWSRTQQAYTDLKYHMGLYRSGHDPVPSLV